MKIAEAQIVAGQGQWNHALLAHMLAPEIAVFTTADVPELGSEFDQLNLWIPNYFLNSVFGLNYGGKWRVYALNFIYRIQNCIREYETARTLTEVFLKETQPGRPAIQSYFRALSSWEHSFFNFKTALDIAKKMSGDIGIFSTGDDSSWERAYYLANVVKHYAREVSEVSDELVTSGLFPEAESEPNSLPMWLTNTGFSSAKTKLTFPDYAELVKALGGVCDKLRNPTQFMEEARNHQHAQQNAACN